MISVSENFRLWQRALKFGVTGISSTTIYVGISYMMINVFAFEIMASSTIAFIAASMFSYLVNTFWSFSERPSLANLIRFIVVTIIGSVVSSLILKYAITFGFGYWEGILIILLIVPILTFIFHHTWTYRQPVRVVSAD